MFTSTLRCAFVALCASVALAATPLEIKGADFINPKTGNRFQLVGVAYQPGGSSGYNPGSGVDPLSDGAVCLRDAALMQRLGMCILLTCGPLDHDACASIFNSVGIYMLIDVNSPLAGESIDRSAPWNSYNVGYLNRTFAVVENFKGYPNTLLFFAGNEVINDVDTGKSVPPYMRAVTRDLKNYIAKHSSRSIPVGYSAADVREILLDTWNYMQCTTTGDASDPSRGDLFALNSYSWCGDSSYTTSGYDVLTADFTNTSCPVFFSEYGCNKPSPRVFTEVPVLYGPLMTPVLSGGLVYEFSQETSNYGLVTINSDGSAQLMSDYDALQGQYNKLNITLLQGTAATNTSVVPPSNFTIPAVPDGVQDLINNGIKNPNNGKIISVSSTKVTQVVKNSAGSAMSGLAITPLADDAINSPSGQNSSSGTATTTTSAPSSTSTKKSSATTMKANLGALLGTAIFVIALL
ncbi:glycoside hydrolase family 72 protein [Halenospora varia]|nr:glycoside hydrolase family 72 protein [Halenospora varia]